LPTPEVKAALDTFEPWEYSSNMKIVELKVVDRYRLFLRFDNGEAGIVDLSHLAGRGVFSAWEEPGVFEQVQVSPEGALQWPGDLDLCPDALFLQTFAKSAKEVFPKLSGSAVHA
jgi:hypothetical protein